MDRTRWIIGNGLDVQFWYDVWILKCNALIHYNDINAPKRKRNFHVATYLNSNRDWDQTQLNTLLPMSFIDKLRFVLPPNIESGSNRLSWAYLNDSAFSTKFLYHYLAKENTQ